MLVRLIVAFWIAVIFGPIVLKICSDCGILR
jgi:hypothetical protein